MLFGRIIKFKDFSRTRLEIQGLLKTVAEIQEHFKSLQTVYDSINHWMHCAAYFFLLTATEKSLPACRRLLFPLLHAEKGRMRNAVANRGAASRAAKEIGDVCKQAINHDLNASKI